MSVSSQNFGNGLGVQYTGSQLILGVHMIDAMNVVAVGDDCALMRSFDGGETWNTRRVPSAQTTFIRYQLLFFVNDTVGYACTQSQNELLKTTDGGETWTSDNVLSSSSVTDIFFTTVDTGYHVSTSGKIYRTIDGGDTWTEVYDDYALTSVWATSTTVWAGAANGTLRKSTDFGQSWTIVNIGATQQIRDLKFADDSVGWAVSFNGAVFKTIDAGQTWFQLPLAGANLYHLELISRDTLFATVGNDTLYRSYNGGVTWMRQRISNGLGVYEVSFDKNSRHGVAVGDYGLILRTNDFGATWTQWVSSGFVSAFNCSSFINTSQGWVGTNSQIMNTTDGGVSWNVQLTGASVLNDIQFVNANNGWAVGNSGYARRTINGGATWTTVTTSVISDIQGVFFVSPTTGWWCGDLGRIYKTTNGGTTWTQQYGLNASQSIHDLYDIHFVNATTGWACGHNNTNNAGTVLKTTNGGTTWTVVWSGFSGDFYYGLWFTDVNNGYVVGSIGPFAANEIYKTTDGGTTWTTHQNAAGHICNDVQFINSTTGFIVARNGTLEKTTDAGLTWTPQVTGFQYELNALSVFSVDTFWLMSNGGYILHNNNCAFPTITSITDNAPLCEGTTLNVTAFAPGSVAYQWYGPHSFSATGNSLVIPAVSDTLSGIFYVAASSNGCQGRYARDTIVVYPLPELPSFTNSDSVHLCPGDSAMLLTPAQQNVTFEWFRDGLSIGNNSNTYATVQPGVYIIHATNACGTVISPDSAVVVQHNNPAVSMTSFAPLCTAVDSVLLTNGSPAGGIYAGIGVSNNTFYPGVAGPGSHTISYTYTDPLYGCDSTVSETVTVNPSPVMPVFTNSDSIHLCTTDTALLEIIPDQYTSYLWYYNGQPTGITTPQFSAFATGIYTIEAYNNCDTLYSDSVHVFVHSTPNVVLSALPALCSSGDSIILSNGSPAGGTYSGTGVINGIFYSSLAGAGSHVITYAFTDTLTGCDSSASTTLLVMSSPAVPFITGPDTLVFCAGDSVQLSIAPQSSVAYAWYLNGQLTAVDTNIFYTSQPGEYIAEVSNVCDTVRSADTTWVIDGQPQCTLDTFSIACMNEGSIVLTGGLPAGGTYSGTAVTGNIFDPAAAGVGTHTITYTYTDPNGCAASDTSQITVDLCMGVQPEPYANGFDVFPNPFSENITVRYHSLNGPATVELFNTLGEKVYGTQVTNATTEIDLGILPQGVYFIVLSDEKTIVTKKIIRQ